MNTSKIKGFTLIELMITVVIVAVLTAIAVPSYTSYIQSSRRADAQTSLLDLANRMEQFFTTNNTYAGATLAGVGMPATSPEGFYTLTIPNTTATSYNLQAAPIGAQAGDTECANFTLDSLGAKGISGTGNAADCW